MPVVVLQAQPTFGSAQHPGARVVIADMERDPQLMGRVLATTHVHHQPFARERVRPGAGRVVFHHLSSKGLATIGGHAGKEGIGRRVGHLVRHRIRGRVAAPCKGQQHSEGRRPEQVHRSTLPSHAAWRKPSVLTRSSQVPRLRVFPPGFSCWNQNRSHTSLRQPAGTRAR